jgi:hypothetical protein
VVSQVAVILAEPEMVAAPEAMALMLLFQVVAMAKRTHDLYLEAAALLDIQVMEVEADLIHIIYIIMLKLLMAILGVIIYHKPVLEAVVAAVQVIITVAAV